LIHEIGHALGLKHPFDGNENLAAAEDNYDYTDMRYTSGVGHGNELGLFDIIAIQQIYGINHSVRSGADSYTFGSSHLIWDGNGTDTVNAAGASASVHLDIGDGTWNWIGAARGLHLSDANQVFIGFGTLIENATDSNFAHWLTGNALATSIAAGTGDDTVHGDGGDDRLMGENGTDLLIGDDGSDTGYGGAGIDIILGDTIPRAIDPGASADHLYGDA